MEECSKESAEYHVSSPFKMVMEEWKRATVAQSPQLKSHLAVQKRLSGMDRRSQAVPGRVKGKKGCVF